MAPPLIFIMCLNLFSSLTFADTEMKVVSIQKDFSKKIVILNLEVENGYELTCTDHDTLYIKNGKNLVETAQSIDHKFHNDGYFLDGTFVSREPRWDEGCDTVDCTKIEAKFAAKPAIFTYKEMASRKRKGKTIRSFEKEWLTGSFLYTYEYYTDEFCSTGKTLRYEFDFNL